MLSDEVYEVVAQGARYWFLFLMVLIAWRSYRWYRRDRKQRKKRLRLLPDAGYVGELVVMEGGELSRGTALPVPREGTLGSLRSNDLCVPAEGIAKKHLWFSFEDGEGLLVEPFRGQTLQVDGEAFESRRHPLYMAHGSRLTVGDVVLRLRMFAGFETGGRAPAMSFADGEREPSDPPQAAALTPEQMAAMQQQMAYQQWMQQQMMQQQMVQQMWMQQQLMQQQAQQQPQPMAQPAPDEDVADDEDAVFVAEDNSLFAPPAKLETHKKRRYMRPEEPTEEPMADASAYAPPVSASPAFAPSADPAEIVFDVAEPFYPIGEEAQDGEQWPYAPFPQSEAQFENAGYTYPEYVGAEEDDMTDAAAPPKSDYIGHDDAEQAKKKLWDKYLGGGHRR